MDYFEYTRAYSDFFWQWEDNGQVIAIPNGNTILYTEEMVDLLEELSIQGLPPFSTLLMSMLALINEGRNIGELSNLLEKTKVLEEHTKEQFAFLDLLKAMPSKYKQGRGRILLLQTIFRNCHNSIGAKKSLNIVETAKRSKYKYLDSRAFNARKFLEDFSILGYLYRKYPTVDSILKSMSEVENYAVEEEVLEELVEEELERNLVEQLIHNQHSYQIGQLVKHIWGGYNLPLNLRLPSDHQQGGVANLKNKGDISQLLLSEFAYEDLAFASRIINNEALYYSKETPPEENKQHRIFLLDISLKNWGTTRMIAYACMLAIAKHPKSTASFSAYAVGHELYPLSFENIEEVIDGLQKVDVCIDASRALLTFFETVESKNAEVFYCAAKETLESDAMNRLLEEHSDRIDYWIHATLEGELAFFKNFRRKKKHQKTIKLPLKELWSNKPKPKRKKTSRSAPIVETDYPIYFPHIAQNKSTAYSSDGFVYKLTRNKSLLRCKETDLDADLQGWELVQENVFSYRGELVIGQNKKGELLVFNYFHGRKESGLYNLITKELKTEHADIKPPFEYNFFFLDGDFVYYHSLAPLCFDEKLRMRKGVAKDFFDHYKQHKDKSQSVAKKTSQIKGSVLKNVKEVFINSENLLGVNSSVLHVNYNKAFAFTHNRDTEKKVWAKKMDKNTFEFKDGSQFIINDLGMYILKSSNKNLPDVFIPGVLDTPIGIASKHEFSGNEFYKQQANYNLLLQDKGPNELAVVSALKMHLNIGLQQARMLVANSPSYLTGVAPEKVDELIEGVENAGGVVVIKSSRKEQNVLPAGVFYEKYIKAFVTQIVKNGN